MKKFLLSLLLITGCATSLSTEQVSGNAKFILDMLNIDSISLVCKKDTNPDKMICTSKDKNNVPSMLSCDRNQCFVINKEIIKDIE